MEVFGILGQAGSQFVALDWVFIIGYFTILFGLAWWVIKKSKDTTDDYFLAGRNLGWFIVGASIFASNIGSEHLVGLAGSGTTDGVAMAHYELHAWCLLVLGWVMVPFYMRSKVFTMPEFLEKRFSPTSRWVLSLISLIAYVITKIAVGIFAGGIVFSVLLPNMHLSIGSLQLDSFWLGSILVIVLTGIYTVLGGLRAVAYTEAIQTIILVIGSLLLTIFGIKALGGWGQLKAVCGSEMFNLWKPLVPKGVEFTWAPVKESGRMAWYFNDNYPWLGMLFCAPIIGLWYWCTDQYIVQRALGAPNEKEARRGSICASFLKLLPVFIFIIPGMICFALAKTNYVKPDNGVAAISQDAETLQNSMFLDTDKALSFAKEGDKEGFQNYIKGDAPLMNAFNSDNPVENVQKVLSAGEEKKVALNEKTGKYENTEEGTGMYLLRGESQKAFPLLVMNILPDGVRGIVVAGLLAALMSSLAGVFNACSTLFTIDFYSKLKPNASQHQLVWTGRVATGVMVVIGLLWIPVIQGSKGLYDYLQGVQSYLAPPIFVVFFFGVFWKRLNAKGCLSALIVGFALGLIRLGIDTPVKLFGTTYAEGSFLWIMNNMFFQYYSILILIVCIFVMVIVSYLTKAPSYEKISGLTYGTVTAEDRKESRSSWSTIDVILSVLLCILILCAYMYFRG